MAKAIIIIPPVQPRRFVLLDKVFPTGNHVRHFDDYWMSESLLPFQTDTKYKGKAQLNHPEWSQFHHNATHGAEQFLIDCKGVVVAPLSFIKIDNDFAGNVYDNHGTSAPVALHTTTFKFNWNSAGLVDGETYFIKTEFYYSLDQTVKSVYISEPILYKTYHKGVLYIDYSHDVNDHGIFWVTTLISYYNVVFRWLVDGYVDEFAPESRDVFFEDQQADLRLLDSKPVRKQTLFVGGNYGVSDYEIDKFLRIMACNNTSLEGKRITKEDGSKIQITRTNQHQIKRADLEFREYYGADAGLKITEYGDGGEGPPDEDGGAGSIMIMFESGKVAPLTTVRLLTTTGEWEDYATELTGIISATDTFPLGLYGSFVYTDGVGMQYIKDDADTFEPVFSFIMYTEIQTTELETNTTDVEYHYQFKGGTHAVDWGDGTIESVTYDGSGDFQTVAHTYTSAGAKMVNIYHNNTGMDAIILEKSDGLDMGMFSNIFPKTISSIKINELNVGGTLDLALFENNAAYIQQLSVPNSGISAIDKLTWGVTKWTAGMKYIDFSGNALIYTEIDEYINAFVEKVDFIGGGYMNFSAQSPPALVTSFSEEARAILEGMGWELIFDV